MSGPSPETLAWIIEHMSEKNLLRLQRRWFLRALLARTELS